MDGYLAQGNTQRRTPLRLHAGGRATDRVSRADGERYLCVVISGVPDRRSHFSETLVGVASLDIRTVSTARELASLRESLREDARSVDVVVVDQYVPDAHSLQLASLLKHQGIGVVLARIDADLDDAMAAMRCGACDLLVGRQAPPDARERILSAAVRARTGRDQAARVVKLKRMCRKLDASRREVERQARTLCTDLVIAYEELARHMNTVGTSTEYQGLIRGELDIESLLRTTLEFVLSRSGPTNAAVFLPTTSGDFSLGAYVNYDCPKDTCDILLDHLANVVAPRFEDLRGVLHLTAQDELDRYLGTDAQWLSDSHVVAMACRAERETLAIVMLFRDKHSPFTPALVEQIRTIGDLFAAQLARVIKIHHRHIPKDKWGMLGDPEPGADDCDDLAA
jgi:DNA-binding NarL/FixJ family response regulator